MNHRFDNFNKQFEKTRKMAIVGAIISAAVGLGVLGFIGWVIIKVMAHFSVI